MCVDCPNPTGALDLRGLHISKRGWVRQASRGTDGCPGRHLRDDGDLHPHVLPGDLGVPPSLKSRLALVFALSLICRARGRYKRARCVHRGGLLHILFNMLSHRFRVPGRAIQRDVLGWWRSRRLPGEVRWVDRLHPSPGASFSRQSSWARWWGRRALCLASSALCLSCSGGGADTTPIHDAAGHQPGVRFLIDGISWQAHIRGRAVARRVAATWMLAPGSPRARASRRRRKNRRQLLRYGSRHRGYRRSTLVFRLPLVEVYGA